MNFDCSIYLFKNMAMGSNPEWYKTIEVKTLSLLGKCFLLSWVNKYVFLFSMKFFGVKKKYFVVLQKLVQLKRAPVFSFCIKSSIFDESEKILMKDEIQKTSTKLRLIYNIRWFTPHYSKACKTIIINDLKPDRYWHKNTIPNYFRTL